MSIELTTQQLQALEAGGDEPPRIIDPRNNASYVLVRESEYETVREILEDEQQQRSIRAVGLRNAIGRLSEQP